MSAVCFSLNPPFVFRKKALRTEELLHPSQLEALIPEWEDLAAHALEPNPFHEHWILRPALENFAGEDVAVLAVRREGRLCALLPVQRVSRYKKLPIRALVSWRHKHSMLCTPLIRAGGSAPLLAAASAFGSLLDVHYVPRHGKVTETLQTAPSYASGSYQRALFLRGQDGDAYVKSALSRHLRQEVRRRERRLAELGTLTHRVMRAGEDAEPWIEEFLRLEAAGWKGREGSALACSEPNRHFALAILRGAAQRARLHMVGLDLDGRPLARCVSLLAGEGAFAFKTAYDEAFSRYSPGVIAEVDRIRAMHELPGVRWMDSYTAPDNDVLNAVWKDRLAVQRLLLGLDLKGKLLVKVLSLRSRSTPR
jgi:CelD/BcsL family acetyltransferase involved in cellulose biosynthesis